MTDDSRRALAIFLRIMRTLGLYAAFLFIWAMAAYAFRSTHLSELPNDTSITHIIRTVMLPFIFFSMARTFAEEDGEVNSALGAEPSLSLPVRVWRVLRTREFQIELGVILALASFLPFEAGYGTLAAWLFDGGEYGRLEIKLWISLIVLPLLTLLMLWARLSAWQKHTDERGARGEITKEGADLPLMIAHVAGANPYGATRLGGTRGFADGGADRISAAERRALRRGYRKSTLVWRVLLLLAIYVIGGFALTFFVPTVISFWYVLELIGSVRWWLPAFLVLLIVGGVWLWLFLRAVRIRKRLFRGLHALCREYGFTHTRIKRPFRSLFRLGDEINFTVVANGKTYDCKLFASMRRHCSLFFHESGVVYCTHSLRFRRVELLSWTTSYHFDFESDHTKVCIVAPVPAQIYAGDDTWHRPIDTGMAVGDYRIFSTTGFLGALQRGCIERD